MKPLIIIPTYNEAENIPELISELTATGLDLSLLFIDDASPDGTADLIKAYQAEGHTIHLIQRQAKLGLASAYLEGFKWAQGGDYTAIVQMDADLSHQPKHLGPMLGHLKNHDLIIGSRYIPGGGVANWPWFRRLLSRGGSFYARLVLNTPITDLTGGYNVWHPGLLAKMNLDALNSNGYCFQIEMKHRAYELGANITEVPITFIERRLGYSKINRQIIFEAIWRTWLIKVRSEKMSRYKKFIKYSLVGATGMTMDISLMIILVELAHWTPLSASFVAFAVSVTNNFIWNKLWTFRDSGKNYFIQFTRFVLTALVGLAINYLMMKWLLALSVNYVIARFIVVAIIVMWNFFINSFWTFRPRKIDLSTDS